MRILAFILAAYVSILSLQPVLSSFNFSKSDSEEICSSECCDSEKSCEKESSKDQKSNDCCPNGICNPFEACACCLGWSFNEQIAELVPPTMRKIEIQETKTEKVIGFISDCFRPPKIV